MPSKIRPEAGLGSETLLELQFAPTPLCDSSTETDHGGDGRSADEAFRLLGVETLMAILHELWSATPGVIGFADIRKRVGVDDSGRFNSHLHELDGHCVASVADGWRLTQSGREVVRAVASGTMTERLAMTAETLDARCVACDGDPNVRIRRVRRRRVRRLRDDGDVERVPAGRPRGPRRRRGGRGFDRWTGQRFRLAMEGSCPNCDAGVETTLG